MKPLIAIVGNTGVGKSQFAVELAKALNGEIINGDAMQMYQGLDIITNKHPVNERQNIPHHLLGTDSWNEQVTVQDFEKRATNLIDRIHAENRLPILVGGTHYYVQSLIAQNALIRDTSDRDTSDAKPNNTYEKRLSENELKILDDPQLVEATLKQVDPVTAAKFHPNDTRRLRRALEIWYEYGKKPSEIYEAQKSGLEDEQLRLRYRVLVFWVWCNRVTLTDRLDSRVLKMVDSGLLNEIEDMYAKYDPDEDQKGIWQVLGFRQFLPYLQQRSQANWDAGVAAMQADTRQYAKKQTKWIRNKLAPFVTSLGGDFALVDASDLTKWSTDVNERGVQLAHDWLRGLPLSVEPVPTELANEVVRRRQAYDSSQWIRHQCDLCTAYRGSDVISMGDDEWELHLKSKGHRAAQKWQAKTRN